MPDPQRGQPAWLDGLAPGGQVLRATRRGATGGLYLVGIAAFAALFVLLTVLRSGNLLIAAAAGAVALVLGTTGLIQVRQGLGGVPILGYDAAGLYVPGAGCVRWADIERIRPHQARGSIEIAVDLKPSRRAQLSRSVRLRAAARQGDLALPASVLPVSPASLLEAIEPLYRSATGRRIPH